MEPEQPVLANLRRFTARISWCGYLEANKSFVHHSFAANPRHVEAATTFPLQQSGLQWEARAALPSNTGASRVRCDATAMAENERRRWLTAGVAMAWVKEKG